MDINKYGQAIVTSDQLREVLLQGKNISHLNVVFDEEIELHKKYQTELLRDTITFLGRPEEVLTFDDFHKKCADDWIFPVEYQTIDVHKQLLNKCKNQEQIDRVNLEYQIYESRDLVMLLRLFIYLIDYMRKNKFVWGVGRGSACSSYCLFLIGVHRVDSIKYNLPITDFLK